MNAYYAAVNNRNITMNSILRNIPDQDTIFADGEMGFGSVRSLSKWIKAVEGGSTSAAYTQLKDFFKLTEAQMQQIAGPSSFLKALYSSTQVSYALQYGCSKFCDNTTMFAIQWASQNITALNSTFISPNVEPVDSLFDLDQSLFGAPPEFSYAIDNLQLKTEPLNLTQTLGLASIASFEDSASIFNPRNLYDFFSSYQARRYENIRIKFRLLSDDQVDAVHDYLIKYVIPKLGNYEGKKGNKQHKSFARLITYTFSKTEKNLQEFLPAETFARYIGASIIKDKRDCKSFVSQVITDADRLEYACANYDFTTYIGSSQWSKAYYHGKNSDSYLLIKQMANLTIDELTRIFDTSDSRSFGKYASDIITDVSKGYSCKNTPCSAQEMGHMQFMDSTITMNINSKYQNIADFLEKAESVTAWGYPVPLEYDYYSEKRCKDQNGLTDDAYNAITQGTNALSDYQNAINFVIDLDQGHNVDHYSEIYSVTSTTLFCVLRYMTQDALLGGILVKKDPYKIIFGYDEPIIEILREGNFIKGSDPSAQAHVSINHVYYNKTLINDTNIEIYTGNRHPEKVKGARSINNEVFINNVVPFFTGSSITYGNINPFKDNFKVTGTDGLQFGKNLSKNDRIQLFDTRKIQEVNYKYHDNKAYDAINTYVYDLDFDSMKKDFQDNSKRNVNYDGFFNTSSNFKLPLGTSPGYFSLCNEADYGKVLIDGEAPTVKQSSVENWMAVEPISGFTIESQRNELVSLNVHEKFLSFPDLDKVNGFIPLMNVKTNLNIDKDTYLERYAFVNSHLSTKFWFRVI